MEAKDKELNKVLYEKMSAEQERYRADLLGKPPEEILNHAYEYATREDILAEIKALELSTEQTKALLASPSPLAVVYKNFHDMKTGHIDIVRECIDRQVEKVATAHQQADNASPLYQQDARYAREHDELDLFRASHKANIACRDAIDTAIQEGYDGMHLHVDVKGVLAEFGPERVSHVLAAALLDKTWDQRISRDNQTWAASVPMFDTGNRHYDYAPRSHSLLLDGFVRQARKEMDAMQKQAEKKPSIKTHLTAAKAVQTKMPAAHQHQKGKETR